MKAVIQRVSSASVIIDSKTIASIENGMLILLGITHYDSNEDISWLCKKIVNLRIFSDNPGLINKSILDINGNILLVSQFTLFASTKKGNRPSFINAAKPIIAEPIYNEFKNTLQSYFNTPIQSGIFGANMKINLTNDGPMTIIIDSKQKT